MMRCEVCRDGIYPHQLYTQVWRDPDLTTAAGVELAQLDTATNQRLAAHLHCPRPYILSADHPAQLPAGLDTDDIGMRWSIGHAIYEWTGHQYIAYRRDGLPAQQPSA